MDFAISHSAFTVRGVERHLGVSYGRANGLVNQLVQLDVLAPIHSATGGASRLFYAPEAFAALVNWQ